MNKKRIIISIVSVIFIILIIFAIFFVRKVLLFQKIKDNLSSRSPYYYYKYITDNGGINNDSVYEYWIYPNDNSIYNRSNFKEIIYNNDSYLLNKKTNVYVKNENVNSEIIKNIDLNMFLPGDDFTTDTSAFKLAVNLKIDTCTMDNQECYKITYKNEDESISTYINKNSFDLIKICHTDKDDNIVGEEKYEWKLLSDEELLLEDVEKELDGYEETTFEEFSQNVEY